jgi:four helix bundle suffix protein
MPPPNFIPAHGNYKSLLSYQKAEAIYDLTFRFTRQFLTRGDRTIDQMVQAARSGKQNIIEGCAASGTSKEMEIKLVGVARASLDELLADYRDFLRVRDLRMWTRDCRESLYVRRVKHDPDQPPFEAYRPLIEGRPAEVVANIAICLIYQANYLLDRQLRALEADFLKHGGIRERMTRARIQSRHEF